MCADVDQHNCAPAQHNNFNAMLRPTILHRGAPASSGISSRCESLRPNAAPLPARAGSKIAPPSASATTLAATPVFAGANCRRRSKRPALAARSSSTNHADVPAVPAARFSRPASDDALRSDAAYIGAAIATWLDEEWAPLPEHAELGRAVAVAWERRRSTGEEEDDDDAATVLLGLANDLLAGFDFGPTFTGAFDVANKAVELGMRRDGMEVCDCGGGGGGDAV
jgi:hypothetical protein